MSEGGKKTERTLDLLLNYLKEDIGYKDITTEVCIPQNALAKGRIISKDNGVIAGLEEASLLFDNFKIDFSTEFSDGQEIKQGDTIVTFSGNARNILILERTVLNIMMRMSGISTITRKLSDICKKYGVIVAGTRKNTPGFRFFEKKAIEIGGGDPHRFGLHDCYLIKDNHIEVTGIEKAIELAKQKYFTKKIEIEVQNTEEMLLAASLGADIIMLDNFPRDELKNALFLIKEKGFICQIEISGGVSPGNIEEYARLQPDIISMGYLTTGARWLDFSLEMEISGN